MNEQDKTKLEAALLRIKPEEKPVELTTIYDPEWMEYDLQTEFARKVKSLFPPRIVTITQELRQLEAGEDEKGESQ